MPDANSRQRLTDPPRITWPLLILSAIVGAATVVGVGWMVYEHLSERAHASPTYVFLVLGLLMGGLSAVAILVGLAAGIHYAHRLTLSVRRIEYREQIGGTEEDASSKTSAGLSSPINAPSAPEAAEPRILEEMLRLLREIGENSLLPDEEKQLKLQRRRAEERRALIGRIEELVGKGDYHLARQLWQEAVDRHGQDSELGLLAQRIEQTRSAAEANDLDQAHRKVADLMSISAWQRAQEVAAEVVAKHPDNLQARELLKTIARERETFEHQQRRRAYADIQKFTSRRQWKEALAAARLLAEKYGDSPEAEAVRSQINTLEANAEIQERQVLENEIKELIKKHRFAEAVGVVHRVIEAYPNSPQAEVLRSQLARLEQKAKQEQAGGPSK